MKNFALSVLILFIGATTVLAQQAATILTSSPGGAVDFCYFNGLAYSENSLLIIEVPDRRESPSATQKALIQCVQQDGSEKLAWAKTNAE